MNTNPKPLVPRTMFPCCCSELNIFFVGWKSLLFILTTLFCYMTNVMVSIGTLRKKDVRFAAKKRK